MLEPFFTAEDPGQDTDLRLAIVPSITRYPRKLTRLRLGHQYHDDSPHHPYEKFV
tara:strand:- start:434 stop:598 length:165 start_codon:yes stop_codon:yes gene_type:complete